MVEQFHIAKTITQFMVATIGVHCVVWVYTDLPKPLCVIEVCPPYLKMANCFTTATSSKRKVIIFLQNNQPNKEHLCVYMKYMCTYVT